MTQSEALGEKVYVELVRSLYANVLPAKIMLGITGLYIALIGRNANDTLLWCLGLVAFAACLVRVGITIGLRNKAMTAALDRAAARRLELSFAIPYYIYSILLGALGAYVFAGPDQSAQMLTICVLVGYCAGVATGTGLRPMVAIPSIVMALGPTLVSSALQFDPIHLGMSLIALSFLIGGAQSVLLQHRLVMTEIGKRLTSISLARRDGLTALPNRLALREHFEENAMLLGAGSSVAVHYLDLDGFKPVNDAYGHAAGDEMLAAVAERLRGAVRSGDVVARLGGDEFGIVQFGLNRAEEADLLARRIIAAIAQPFQIGDDVIEISACVGTVVSSEAGIDLETLLRQADAKLYEAKRNRPPIRTAL